jgi:hypothetical protein
MGIVFMREGYTAEGDLRAPDCVYCHMPALASAQAASRFRRDRVTLHDPSPTVQKHSQNPDRLSEEAISFLTPLCSKCHSERNARYRLENSASLLRAWTPIGMTAQVRRKPIGNGEAEVMP